MGIRVDSREPKHIVRYFRRMGWQVEHKKFAECADVADWDLTVIIERKGGPDVVASIYDGRLFSQVERMFNFCELNGAIGYVVIYGDLESSIRVYEKNIAKGLRKQGKKISRGWSLNISTASIYKKVAMIPWHYDVNVLWFVTEEEALECIHYMIQEVSVSDPFTQTINKRKRSKVKTKKKKKAKSRRGKKSTTRKPPTMGPRVSKPSVVARTGTAEETDEAKYRRLGLI